MTTTSPSRTATVNAPQSTINKSTPINNAQQGCAQSQETQESQEKEDEDMKSKNQCRSCSKARAALHRQTPESKAKQKAKQRAYRQTPEGKAKNREYQQKPEVKNRVKAARMTPEFKARKLAYGRTPKQVAYHSNYSKNNPNYQIYKKSPEYKESVRASNKRKQDSLDALNGLSIFFNIKANIKKEKEDEIDS